MQGYIDAIQAKTGKTIDELKALITPHGFTKHAACRAWIMQELGLGHGHASLLAKLAMEPDAYFERTDQDRIEPQYAGKKAHWRPLYERLLAEATKLGPDVGIDASDAYVSFVKNGKKFAIAQPSTADRFDLGFKLKGEPTTERFEAAGKWNPMVTHRLRINDASQVDDEVLAWLAQAYAAVKG